MILPLAIGSIAHLFVVYGYQDSSEDLHKLALTSKLLEAVTCEARMCGTGQLVVISGDLSAEPSVIPVTARGFLVDLEAAFADGRRAPLSLPRLHLQV